MKTKITLCILVILASAAILFFPTSEKSEIEELRAQHVEYLKKHRFNKSLDLTRTERKKLGIPPNKYFEQEYLREMNPATGKAEFEKKFALQEELLKQVTFKNVPGTDTNAWEERGPNNVPGRTRAILFDPNDVTGKRVFAGGVSGGLWVNNDITNQNSSWTRVGIPENLAVSSITVDPTNSQIMYLGTGESYTGGDATGNGIFKSTNGGSTWTNVLESNQGIPFFNGGSTVTVNSPGSIAGSSTAAIASFGPSFTSAITGNLVLVDDGTLAPTEGCNAFINGAAISGNIAVIERGACNFTVKVKNAQNEGALAVLMINNIDGNPFTMGGTDGTITIPSVMISKADGAAIITALASQTVNATLNEDASSLPSGVTLVPGIFHVNDIVARNNGGTIEIYAAIADGVYGDAPGTLLGQGSEYGLYRSTNGGSSWTQLNLPLTTNGNPFEPNDIEIASDNTIWFSTTSSSSYGDGGGTIFSSTNGTNFTQRHVVPNASRTEIEISATNPDKIYVLAQENPITILRTTDGFTSVETLALPDDADNGIPADDFTRGQAFYDLMLETDPTNDDIVYVGGIDIFRSTTGGVGTPPVAWTQISKWSNNANLNSLTVPGVHADIHELSFDPTNPDKAIIATDGGVYYANSLAAADGSTSAIFSSFSNYNTTQFYWGAIGQDALNEQFLGGAQDNGSNYIDGGSSGINDSDEIFGGDGAYSFIDKDGQYLVVALPFNNYRRFNLPITNSSNALIVVSNEDEGNFINPAELDDNLNILFTNASSVTGNVISSFINVNANALRRNLTDALLSSSPTAFKVSPYTTTSTTLLVGTVTGSLLKVENANNSLTATWSSIAGPEFLGSISALNFGANEDQIFVTFHNYGVKSIWYTNDGGTTWQDKEGDFPDIPVKAIMMNPLLNNEVIIGTDLGVWRSDNFASTNPSWVQSQNGMQNVKVTSFDLRTSDNTVLASTYGRGLFTGKFTAAPLTVEEIAVEDDRIVLYPNPTNGNLKIRTTLDFGQSTITVFDLNGRAVYSQKNTIAETVDINVSNLSSGVYILRIDSDAYAYNKKFIIE
jgi:photosystem II stability/assembly factor-like uncharacterized protein